MPAQHIDRVRFYDSMTLLSVMSVVNILSFIPGGVGVSEADIAEPLVRTGRSSSASQAGALAIPFYGGKTVLLGAVHFLIWRTSSPWPSSQTSSSKPQ